MASAMRSVFDTQEELRECGRVGCRTPSSELLKPLPLGHQALRQATSCCRTRADPGPQKTQRESIWTGCML